LVDTGLVRAEGATALQHQDDLAGWPRRFGSASHDVHGSL
jgi:hypothetical protein